MNRDDLQTAGADKQLRLSLPTHHLQSADRMQQLIGSRTGIVVHFTWAKVW